MLSFVLAAALLATPPLADRSEADDVRLQRHLLQVMLAEARTEHERDWARFTLAYLNILYPAEADPRAGGF